MCAQPFWPLCAGRRRATSARQIACRPLEIAEPRRRQRWGFCILGWDDFGTVARVLLIFEGRRGFGGLHRPPLPGFALPYFRCSRFLWSRLSSLNHRAKTTDATKYFPCAMFHANVSREKFCGSAPNIPKSIGTALPTAAALEALLQNPSLNGGQKRRSEIVSQDDVLHPAARRCAIREVRLELADRFPCAEAKRPGLGGLILHG